MEKVLAVVLGLALASFPFAVLFLVLEGSLVSVRRRILFGKIAKVIALVFFSSVGIFLVLSGGAVIYIVLWGSSS